MLITGTFLNRKISRRLFGLFLLAALIPISLFAFLAFQQIDQIRTSNTQKELRQDAKSFGLLVLDRLDLIKNELQFYDHLAPGSHINSPHKAKYLSWISVEKSHFDKQNNPVFSSLTAAETSYLAQGNTLLHLVQNDTETNQILMIRPNLTDGKIIIANLALDWLWEDNSTFSEPQAMCVFAAKQAEPLSCTEPKFKQQLTNYTRKKAATNEHYHTANWVLFLKPRYFYQQFNIVTGTDKKQLSQQRDEITELFLLITILAIVIVALFSTIQIRRYMKPVSALMKGIDNIAQKNFGHPVEINTDDEFKQLGDSFNNMSKQIANQIDFLTTLSEIDQLMLNNLSEHDIVSITINQANTAVQASSTHVAVINPEQSDTLTIYQEDSEHIHGMSSHNATISASEKQRLLANNTIIYTDSHNQLRPKYLANCFDSETGSIVIVPVLLNDALKAILIFNFDVAKLAEEIHYRLKELANRVAIAFEKSEWESKLYQNAHYDHLTGLPNRLLLHDRLQQSINQAQQHDSVFSILFLDLDKFKSVNDSFGHNAGDSLLKIIANKLVDILGQDVTVSRIGGDEFIILLANQINNELLYTDTTDKAEQLLAALSEPLTIEDHIIHLSTSIGIANFPDDGETAEDLITHADSAMYHAKSNGRDNYQFYTAELNEKALQKLILKTELYDAIDDQQFEVYYQAKVCTQSHNILGAEALIRWNHPEKGLIPPYLFIPIAEETGLITKIGEWVLDQCCKQNKQWQDQGLAPIKISVNLSPKQFQQPNLVSYIETTLAKHKLEANYLDLEIVEGTAMQNTDETIKTLKQLKALDLYISIDDYGTGFSSLSYIKQFPVDTLKIDKSFIDNIVSDKGDQAIVKSTITLAHNIGLSVVAEGIEDSDQLHILKQYGCDEIQGYYFSKPVPTDEFEQLLRQSPLKT